MSGRRSISRTSRGVSPRDKDKYGTSFDDAAHRIQREMEHENAALGLDGEEEEDAEAKELDEGDADPVEEAAEKTENLAIGDSVDEPRRQPTKSMRKKKAALARSRPRSPDPAPLAPETVDEGDKPTPIEAAVAPTKREKRRAREAARAQRAESAEGVDEDGTTETSLPPEPAPTKREKRRAKDAAKKQSAPVAPDLVRLHASLVYDILSQRAAQSCNVCAESFASRTKLFEHINATGHALAAFQPDIGKRKARR